MKEPIVRNYLAVTVVEDPKASILEESTMPKRISGHGPISHGWLRSRTAGVVGVKFSSWMIRQAELSKAEKTTVAAWNKSESDFEVFFGDERDYDQDLSQDDESGSAYLLRLNLKTLAICFPLQGSSLAKREAEALVSTLSGPIA